MLAETPIDQLAGHIRTRYHRASIQYTPSLQADGVHWLDIIQNGRHIVVQWSEATAFGISDATDSDLYTHQPDESFDSLDGAKQRLDILLSDDHAPV